MATSLAVLAEPTVESRDSVRFVGQPEYAFRVTRTFPNAPHKRITITVERAQLPKYTGAHGPRTRDQIVLEHARPILDRMEAEQS